MSNEEIQQQCQEFSNAFDVLLNSYVGELSGNKQSNINLDEYEKSLCLTKAQTEVVIDFYNGNNLYGTSFESTEETRRYLDSLIRTKVYSAEEQNTDIDTKVSPNSVVYSLPSDIAFITMEQVTYDDPSLKCYNGSTAAVYPVTQDEYNKVRNNPFRGPTKYKVIRLDSGDNVVELVSQFKIGTYFIKYLSKPEPIILEDLGDLSIDGKSEQSPCKLNPILHNTILNRAVQIALKTRGIQPAK